MRVGKVTITWMWPSEWAAFAPDNYWSVDWHLDPRWFYLRLAGLEISL